MDRARIGIGLVNAASEIYVEGEAGSWKLKGNLWRDECRKYSNLGYNTVRIILPWIWRAANYNRDKGLIVSPWPYDRHLAKWDVTKTDDSFYAVVLSLVKLANENGLQVWLDLFDGCINRFDYSPLHLNTTFNGPFQERGWPFLSAYIARICDVLSGKQVIYGFANEMADSEASRQGGLIEKVICPELIRHGISTDYWALGCQVERASYDMISDKFLEPDGGYQQKAQRAAAYRALRTAFGAEQAEKLQIGIIAPVHGCLANDPSADWMRRWGHMVAQIERHVGYNPEYRFQCSDDGNFMRTGDPGASEDDFSVIDSKVQRRPSADRWGDFVGGFSKKLQSMDKLTIPGKPVRLFFEVMPKAQLADGRYDFNVQKKKGDAIAAGYKATIGVELANRSKYPPISPMPDPQPEPQPPKPQPIMSAWKYLSIHSKWLGIPKFWQMADLKNRIYFSSLAGIVLIIILSIL